VRTFWSLSVTTTGLAPAAMHFFVHASESALAPLTPHFESLTQPFTVWASLANDTEATNKISATASNNKRSFRMAPSLNWFPQVVRSLNFITGGAKPALSKTGEAPQPRSQHLSVVLTFVVAFRSGRAPWVASAEDRERRKQLLQSLCSEAA